MTRCYFLAIFSTLLLASFACAEEPPAEAATTEEAAVQAEPGEGAVEEAETAKEA